MCNRFQPAQPKALQHEADLGEVGPGIGRIDSVSPLVRIPVGLTTCAGNG